MYCIILLLLYHSVYCHDSKITLAECIVMIVIMLAESVVMTVIKLAECIAMTIIILAECPATIIHNIAHLVLL